jgi:hypothetical protein
MTEYIRNDRAWFIGTEVSSAQDPSPRLKSAGARDDAPERLRAIKYAKNVY